MLAGNIFQGYLGEPIKTKVDVVAQTEITVTHNLNRDVFIAVRDSNGEDITSGVEIDVLSSNHFRVSGTPAITGSILYF